MKKKVRPMRPAYVVSVATPKRFLLDGLWFGPKSAKTVIVFIHGLTSSAFAMSHLLDALVDKRTAVLSFNNRGFKIVADIKQINTKGDTVKWRNAGAAHEVFTECVDDIQGAVNFALASGAREIFLMGHSTGCQKAAYWAGKGGRRVKGIIFLGPLSDYACAHETGKNKVLERTLTFARALVRRGKPHELLPKSLTGEYTLDAQRFLSLYTPDSTEEIFSYAQPRKVPRTLRAVRLPVLAFLAGSDEHTRTPAPAIAEWFSEHLVHPLSLALVVPDTPHNFKGAEKRMSRTIKEFMKEAVQCIV